MSDLQEMYQEKGKLVEDMRALIDAAIKEERDFNSEEEQKYAEMEKDLEGVSQQIKETEAREERRKKRLEEIERREEELKTQPKEKRVEKAEPEPAEEEREQLIHRAICQYLYRGENRMGAEETRALQADLDKSGGYLVMPEKYSNQLRVDLNNLVFVRNQASIMTLDEAASFAMPELEDDPADATWTAEIKTGSEDSTMDFNKRVFYPHPLAQRIKVSKTLLRLASLNVDAVVRDRLAYKFGVVEENAYLNGNGHNQPLGVFVADNNGITTGRDVTSGVSADIEADDVWNMMYSIKKQYRQGGLRWCMHRDVVKVFRKLKTGEGQFIYTPGLRPGEADVIAGYPIDESEYAPNTFSSSSYIALLGNWKYYQIVEMLAFNIQVLTELYAETNQNGYIARREVDGAPKDENGFARLKLA